MELDQLTSRAKGINRFWQSTNLKSKEMLTFWSMCLVDAKSIWVLQSISHCPMDPLMNTTLCIVKIQREISTFRLFNQLVVSFSIMTLIKRSLAMGLALEFPHKLLLPIVLRLTEIFLSQNVMALKKLSHAIEMLFQGSIFMVQPTLQRS